jgi:hypothetical protein
MTPKEAFHKGLNQKNRLSRPAASFLTKVVRCKSLDSASMMKRLHTDDRLHKGERPPRRLVNLDRNRRRPRDSNATDGRRGNLRQPCAVKHEDHGRFFLNHPLILEGSKSAPRPSS